MIWPSSFTSVFTNSFTNLFSGHKLHFNASYHNNRENCYGAARVSSKTVSSMLPRASLIKIVLIAAMLSVSGFHISLQFPVALVFRTAAAQTASAQTANAQDAQAPDEIINSYQDAKEALQTSVRILREDAVGAQENLERAANALRTLANESTSVSLISGLESTFEQARTAINERSETNLAVQVSVLEGGFRRLLYEAALLSLATNPSQATTRLVQLAVDLNFGLERQQAISDLGSDQARQRANVELAVLGFIQARLDSARSQAADNTASAYRQFADAYGASVIIQDSPRLPDINSPFEAGFNALLNQQPGQFNAQLDQLGQIFGQARQDALAVLDAAPAASPTPIAPPPEATPASPPETTAEATSEAATPAPVAAPPEAAPVVIPPPAIETAPAEVPAEVPTPTPTPEVASQELTTALASYNVRGDTLDQLTARYAGAGFNNVNAASGVLYELAMRALVALEQGQQESAKDLLAESQLHYNRFLSDLVAAQDAATDSSTNALLDSLLASPALRVQDTILWAAHMDTLNGTLDGVPTPLAHDVAVTTQMFWGGSVRLAIMVVLAFLAFVPLALLNLAFGGSNRNWQLVGVALFFLFLPVIYEGLSYLGTFLADLTEITWLDSLARFSIFQNTISQVVWTALMALAILFATIGLRGICVQFGLIGKRKQDEPSTPEVAPVTTVPANATGSETVVDWDEEF